MDKLLSTKKCPKCDLSEADLSDEVDLSNADLTKANLNGAYLIGANLEGAKLEGAKLEYADLEGATLTMTNLTWAWLAKANLTKADLTKADLTNADLNGANLDGAILCYTTMPDGNKNNVVCNKPFQTSAKDSSGSANGPENQAVIENPSFGKAKMCSSRTDKSKPCMACIANCGKGPTTEIEPYQDKDENWKGRQIICIDGGESLECHCRFDACRVSCGGGPSTDGSCE